MEHKSSSPPETAMPRAPAIAAKPHENGNGIATHGSFKAPLRDALVEMPPQRTAMATRSLAVPGTSGEPAAWLNAYEAIQCRTAEAHILYQQTMAQCHLAFLRAAEQSAMALASLAGGAPAVSPALARSGALASPEHRDSFATTMPSIPWSTPKQAPIPPPVAARSVAIRPPTPVPVADPGVPGPMAAPKAPPPAAVVTLPTLLDGDMKTFLLNVISEKTGYPVEILNLDQRLEADLGIDSIKRVEILSAFEGQIPDIKDVNLEEVASLSTLRDVVAFMEKFSDQLGLAKKENDGRPD